MFRPLALKTVRWRPLKGEGLEHLTLRPVDDGILAEGVIVGGAETGSYGVFYRIACDTGWTVRSFSVRATDGRRLDLVSDGRGHWQKLNGTALPALDGCIDIDLSGTAFTNTLPIRRLDLSTSAGRQKLLMLYIPLDTLEPFPDGQNYTCLADGRLYRYEADDRTFSADLPVDEDGLVLDYPTLFQRL